MPCAPGHPADAILRGDALTFASNQTCTGNAAVQCYVAIPRAAAAIRFDGGDRIVTSGGPLSIIHDQNPDSPYSGGSTEVLPKQAYAGATSYSIPVGENQYAGPSTPYEFVQFAAIDVVAFEADTQVFINSPGVPHRLVHPPGAASTTRTATATTPGPSTATRARSTASPGRREP